MENTLTTPRPALGALTPRRTQPVTRGPATRHKPGATRHSGVTGYAVPCDGFVGHLSCGNRRRDGCDGLVRNPSHPSQKACDEASSVNPAALSPLIVAGRWDQGADEVAGEFIHVDVRGPRACAHA
jgi:hypothetical protein